MAITIRPPTKDEMPRIGQLAAEMVRHHHRLDPERFMLREPLEDGYARFLWRSLEDPAVVVLAAIDEEKGPIGYTYARVEGRDWNRLLDEHGKLHDIYVDPAFRRGGVARRLAEATFEKLTEIGAKRILLDTAAPNDAARALFASMGFEPTMIEMMRRASRG